MDWKDCCDLVNRLERDAPAYIANMDIARKLPDGVCVYVKKSGEKYCKDAPTEIGVMDGTFIFAAWKTNGLHHNYYGPAHVGNQGFIIYCLHGEQITYKQFAVISLLYAALPVPIIRAIEPHIA